MARSTHYVCAGYLGPRRDECPIQRVNRLHFIQQHVIQLHRLQFADIGRITFVMQHDPASSPWDRRLDDEIPITVNGVEVRLEWRSNDQRLSYGGLIQVANNAPEYEFTIFTEDDYLFTVDRFDEWLRDNLRPEASLLCGAVYPHPTMPIHAAVSCGIMRTRDLIGMEIHGQQLGWSAEMVKRGELHDWRATWATAFKNDGGSCRWFTQPNTLHHDRSFVAPVQLLGISVRRNGHRP